MLYRVLQNRIIELVLLCTIVLVSRISFLWAGFGVEEDSWLLAITAKNIALSGSYEMSRAPAHPLQEIVYSWMYNGGLSPFATNLLSALGSVVSVLFFALSLKNIGLRHYLFASFAFAFTPVVFISSTYTIDYMLAMSFIMMSFYFVTSKVNIRHLLFAGIFLGVAIGFRITSIIMLVPFCILLFSFSKEGTKNIFILSMTAGIAGLLTYVPVLQTYGPSFFTYSDQFPYPNFPKLVYKATIGVFGTIGIVAIFSYKLKVLLTNKKSIKKIIPEHLPRRIFYACLTVFILYAASYLKLPQKSAYLIPAVPFLILLFGYYLHSNAFKIFCILITMSSFLFSMNLTDPLRGSEHSSFAVKFSVANQEIFVDPLTGPIFSDYTKRLNKITFTEKVYQKIQIQQTKIVLICGWWYNELLVRSWNCEMNQNVKLVFYIDGASMKKYISEGYEIFHLPEQNIYNDQYSQINYTDSLSKPYF